MPIPTENVGSLPRPMRLQQAIAAYDRDEITKEQLGAEQDAAARDSVERMDATGSIGESIRTDADGVKQVAFIGVIDPPNPTVETLEAVAADLVAAARHIPVDQLGATDDCGFSPFSIDEKPRHGSPDFARDIAFQKISAREAGAMLAAQQLGV